MTKLKDYIMVLLLMTFMWEFICYNKPNEEVD